MHDAAEAHARVLVHRRKNLWPACNGSGVWHNRLSYSPRSSCAADNRPRAFSEMNASSAPVASIGVAGWPLFGWLAHAAGTIFVDRQRPLATAFAVNRIHAAIATGLPVVLFPEGTSSDGSTVLPFKSSLLESAVQLRCSVAAGTVGYALDHGSVADEVCYWRDMTLVPHLLNLFFKREICSKCSFSYPKIRTADRNQT